VRTRSRISIATALPALLALALTVLLVSPAPALAAFQRDRTPLSSEVTGEGGPSGDAATASATSAGTGGAIVRMVVGLAIVLAVIYGVYWLLKAYSRSRTSAGGDERVEVIATTGIAPNRALHIVRAGDEVILLGVTEQRITPIRTWSAEEAQAQGIVPRPQSPYDVPGQLERQRPAGGSFLARFVENLRAMTVRA
jgi:flagellar protein FliO/FliZ